MAGFQAKAVQALTTPVEVWVRSTKQIKPQRAEIFFDDRAQLVQISFLDDSSQVSTREIKISEIERVKARTFAENGEFQWVLHISEKGGGSTSFQFERKELCDNWSGLQSLIEEGGKAVERKTEFLKIQDMKLIEKPGVLIALQLDLGHNKPEELIIPETLHNPEEWKGIVTDFIARHFIVASDGTSLYRYIKAVCQRIMVERETKRLVNEIDNCYIDRVIEAMTENAQSGIGETFEMEDTASVLEECKDRLTQLEHQLARVPIWQSGSGPIVVATILRRNIEKMKLINETTMQARMKVDRERRGSLRSSVSGSLPTGSPRA